MTKVSIRPHRSGIANVLTVVQGSVMVAIRPPYSDSPFVEAAYVRVSDGRLLAEEQEIEAELLGEVQLFIERNREPIQAFWRHEIDQIELLERIRAA